MSELLKLKYVPLSTVTLWDKNPKKHNVEAIIKSFTRYGFQNPPKYDSTLKAIIAGNGRIQALILMKHWESKPPTGIGVDPDTEDWLIPIVFGNDMESLEAAAAFAIDDNNITIMSDETVTAEQLANVWDRNNYVSVLNDLVENDGMIPISTSFTDIDLLNSLMPDVEQSVDFNQPEFDLISLNISDATAVSDIDNGDDSDNSQGPGEIKQKASVATNTNRTIKVLQIVISITNCPNRHTVLNQLKSTLAAYDYKLEVPSG